MRRALGREGMDAFDHRKLEVYRSAVRFAEVAEGVAGRLPRAHAGLADQLRRAAASIVLNIAEGAAETRPREKARLYRLARRSTAECSAILDLVNAVARASTVPSSARSLLFRLSLVLDRLVERHDHPTPPA
jgi:four helix bundle protein